MHKSASSFLYLPVEVRHARTNRRRLAFLPEATSLPRFIRPDLEDVLRITRGEAARRRGVGSREVCHRLNAEEAKQWAVARERGYLTLVGGGQRRERKGSPLANSWRLLSDALAHPAVVLYNSLDSPSCTVALDFSPLRSASMSAAAVHECRAVAALTQATLVDDFIEEEALEEALPIWALPVKGLSFMCETRADGKSLAESCAKLLCGAKPVKKQPRVRLQAVEDEEE